ncbi:nucleotide sugar dehydrogenase [Mollicutes bacterium LVI A0039]|nr:nucleotide sugar dehydrogenase [Mollicutes bacterium LVI A0039]
MQNITVVGAGYVGLANSFLIGITNGVTLYDISQDKINQLQQGKSPITDEYIAKYIDQVQVTYTTNDAEAYTDADVIFVAVDTNYDEERGKFNLDSVNNVLHDIARYASDNTIIVIKSTVPIGFTDEKKAEYPQFRFIFSPEFLREGHALYDNLYPDRIVIGGADSCDLASVQTIGQLLSENILSEDVPIVYVSNREAEVVKLFANTYLAMRVSFVNELDTYCQSQNMETAHVLDAIGYDKRIGRDYWNPSFGYGGYCLPKDTKQLDSEYVSHNIPQNLVSNIVKSNETRKQFIADKIIELVNYDKDAVIGIYRVIAKKGINNFRSSAVLDIAQILVDLEYQVLIYEPYATAPINGINIDNDFASFEQKSAVIVANRIEEMIKNNPKVYSTDIYNMD